MASFKQYDIVELTEDFPEDHVTRGTRGTVLEVYDAAGEDEAYEIEISDADGRSVAQFVAAPQQLRSATPTDSILR